MQKSDTFEPTSEMSKNAQRGVDLRAEFGRGGTSVGMGTARSLINGTPMTMAKVKQMAAFFIRHEKDYKSDWANASNPTNGYIAHMLWGGASGYTWANSIRDRAIRAGVWYS